VTNRGLGDDISDIRDHYQTDPELEADRLNRHPVEFEITMRYFKRYLPNTGAILDIGCGAGTYAIPLAKAGYDVSAVDLTPALVQMCNEFAEREAVSSSIETHVADARDLSFLPDCAFDAVAVMGPLYHLIDRDDRQTAIREALSKIKPGAPFFSAHVSRIGMLPHVATRVPEWIEDHDSVASILSFGHDGGTHPRDGGFRGYFTTIDELPPLHEELGLETIAIAASDPACLSLDTRLRDLSENQKRLWLDVLFKYSTEPSFRGAWPHLLYIGRKRDQQ
jgi:SAM-dependent methyltransferase